MEHIFRDAEFMSARDKQLVLKAWVRFLKNGLRFENFPKRLYEHLHLHRSFIAHYNLAGFYAEYFENGQDTVRFLSQFDSRGECRSVEYGGPWRQSRESADLNEAMLEEGSRFIPALIEEAQTAQRDADIAVAHMLLAKHGLQP
jgi:hypothetical protein